MSTLRELARQNSYRQDSMKSVRATKETLRVWRRALIGLLLICVSLTSACSSKSKLPEPQRVTVDASLMVEPNLTTTLLKELSE